MLRKIGLATPLMFAASVVKVVDEKAESQKTAKQRPKDLPIYSPLFKEEKYRI